MLQDKVQYVSKRVIGHNKPRIYVTCKAPLDLSLATVMRYTSKVTPMGILCNNSPVQRIYCTMG